MMMTRIPRTLVMMILVTATVLLIGQASEASRRRPGLPEVEVDPEMTRDEAIEVLETSRDDAELEAAALSLVQSEEENALNALAGFLKDEDFLRRLDDDDRYRRHFRGLRVFRVLNAVGALATKEADAVLVELARHELYHHQGKRAHPNRHDSLIVAAGDILEPSDALLDYLKGKIPPGRGGTTRAVVSLAQMRSDRAQDRVVEWLLDVHDRLSWFGGLVRVRNNPNVVAVYRRLIEDEIERIENERSRITMVRHLFRPKVISRGTGRVISPPREEASTDVLRELLEIAEIALGQEDLHDPQTLQVVRDGRKEIERILAEREEDRAEPQDDDEG